MKEKVLTIKIAGPAGMGIKSGGKLLSSILLNHGYFTCDYSEYPSLIRGGRNTYQVSFSGEKIHSVHSKIDLSFSLEPNQLFANTVCVGTIAYLFGLNPEICKKIIAGFFKDEVKENIGAFRLGYQSAQKNYPIYLKLPKRSNKNLNLYDGNEAFGWGFLKGGGNFYASYPMTPATGLLHFLAAKQKEFKIIVRHPEDEIAAANLSAGAAFAGARAAVGTSGGGFALMNETISFCGMAGIGMVFYLAQRSAPATGMPTWTAQGDLLYAVFCGHGEFPKVVLAPADQKESFEFGWKSLNLAKRLQIPIIVISDKFLAEASKSILHLENKKVKADCHSPQTLPGTPGGEFLANSYEHDEKGFSIEDAQVASKMAKKRMVKLKTALKITPRPSLHGNRNAKKLIVSWGSTKGPILEALSDRYAFLQIKTLWPLHPEIEKTIKKFKEIIVVENNQTSQLTTLLRTQFNFQPTKKILKFNGRPFFPEELHDQLK